MTKSPQDNFIRCHAALHALLSDTIPSLQHAIDTWHQKITATTQPCSNPAHCPPYKKPSTKNNSCPECIAWATAIEAQVYPHGSLQWMNADSTLFGKDPLEVIKLFVLRMPANQRTMYSSLGDFDTASLLMIMGKFKEFHQGNQIIYDNIQKVAQIRNSLAHLKHSKSLQLDDNTFNNYWTDIATLVNCLPGIGRPYFTQKTAQDVITKLKEIKDQTIPVSVQQEALKPLIEDMVLKTLEDNKPNQPIPSTTAASQTNTEPHANPQLWQKQLKDIYRCQRRGIAFLPGFPKEFPSDKFFVDLHLVEEQKSPTKVRQVDLRSYADLISLQDESGQSINHVVVSGLGGTGKSTMVSRLAYQWAKVDKKSDEESLNKFDLVFLLDIRKFQPDMDLVDAIQTQLLTRVPKNHIETYLSANADKCLFLFDGYDELSAGERVLQSDLLCGGLVIVTTRPNKVDKFNEIQKKFMYVHVTLNGFSDKSVRQFVEKFFGAKNHDLQHEIESNQELRALSHFPLLLGMICLIWGKNEKLPNTISGLYQEVCKFLARHWNSRKEDEGTFIGPVEEQGFDQTMVILGKTALRGLIEKSRLNFKVDEFESPEIVEKGCTLSLMSKDSEVRGLDKIMYVSFIHKTFQEYCAALYLSSLADTDVNLLKSYLSQMDCDDMEYVLRFCCGTSKKCGELILNHVVQLTKVDSKRRDSFYALPILNHVVQLKGVDSEERDSCRLPLILLFESESTFGVNITLHTILRPAVENITMYLYHNRSDPVYLAALQYVVDEFESQHEWTNYIKIATIEIGDYIGVYKQLELLNKMLHMKKLNISNEFDSYLLRLIPQINMLIGSVEEVTLTCSVSVNTIHTFIHQIPHPITLHLDRLTTECDTKPEILSCVLQTIGSKSGSVRELEVILGKCKMSKVMKYVSILRRYNRCIDRMLEGMVQAGKILNSHNSMSNDLEVRTTEDNTSQQLVYLPIEEFTFRSGYRRHKNLYLHNSLRKLCTVIVYSGNLKKLNLSDCSLVEASFTTIGRALSNLTCLQVLDLSKNTIGKSLKAMIQGINHNKITHLGLSNTNLTKESKSELPSLQLPLLEELHLSHNDIDLCDAKALAVSLMHMPKLKYLGLDHNMLGSQGVIALCESFQYITHLEKLYLDDNQIQSDGAKAIASALQDIPNLDRLNLSHNQIQSDGAKALASALQYTPNLPRLDLPLNHIQSDGAIALASAFIQYTPNLYQLGLSHNQIQCDGAKAIASALQHIPNLKRLNLSDNQIQCDGAIAFASALQHIQHSFNLGLYENPIQSDGIKALESARQCNTHLHCYC